MSFPGGMRGRQRACPAHYRGVTPLARDALRMKPTKRLTSIWFPYDSWRVGTYVHPRRRSKSDPWVFDDEGEDSADTPLDNGRGTPEPATPA